MARRLTSFYAVFVLLLFAGLPLARPLMICRMSGVLMEAPAKAGEMAACCAGEAEAAENSALSLHAAASCCDLLLAARPLLPDAVRQSGAQMPPAVLASPAPAPPPRYFAPVVLAFPAARADIPRPPPRSAASPRAPPFS